MAAESILVVNAGSTSLKLAVFDRSNFATTKTPLWRHSTKLTQGSIDSEMRTALAALPDEFAVAAVGHRVVHGGHKYAQPASIDEQTLRDLRSFVALAPLHQPASIAGVEAAIAQFPQAAQIAVFDTAYFHDMPEASIVYPGPYEWYEERKIRRFGFHGLSHQYCASQASSLLGRDGNSLRVISCHLGGGASITASLGGRAQATTMGYTPLEGLMMGTRSGSIDPGLILHLLEQKAYSIAELGDVLNHSSGLKGISGVSADIPELEKLASEGHERAQLALDMFAERVASHLCSMLPVLGGVDAIVFTAGIGEHSANLRNAVCSRIAFLGVALDRHINAAISDDTDVSSPDAAVRTLVIRAREDYVIAQYCAGLTSGGQCRS